MTQQIPHPAPPPWLTGVTKWPDELRAGRLLGIERAAPDRDSLRGRRLALAELAVLPHRAPIRLRLCRRRMLESAVSALAA